MGVSSMEDGQRLLFAAGMTGDNVDELALNLLKEPKNVGEKHDLIKEASKKYAIVEGGMLFRRECDEVMLKITKHTFGYTVTQCSKGAITSIRKAVVAAKIEGATVVKKVTQHTASVRIQHGESSAKFTQKEGDIIIKLRCINYGSGRRSRVKIEDRVMFASSSIDTFDRILVTQIVLEVRPHISYEFLTVLDKVLTAMIRREPVPLIQREL